MVGVARTLRTLMGPLTLSTETAPLSADGGLLVLANHSSLADPVIVAAALRRLGLNPVFMAAAGLWRVPLLGTFLERGRHIPVHRGGARAADALTPARAALEAGGVVVMYPEGGIPHWLGSGDEPPSAFKSGAARLLRDTGVRVLPVGQAGARRVVSGGTAKQLAGAVTSWARRPGLHVHVGTPAPAPDGEVGEVTAELHERVTRAWKVAAARRPRRTG